MHLVNQAFNWLIETSLVLTWVVMFAITAIAGDLGFRLGRRRADILISDEEYARRKAAWTPDYPASQTPWQELQRRHVTQLSDGACLDFAVSYQRIAFTRGLPRDNH